MKPADLRDASGERDGATVVAGTRDGAPAIGTMAARLRRLRDVVRSTARGAGSDVEAVLAEKRAEAARG